MKRFYITLAGLFLMALAWELGGQSRQTVYDSRWSIGTSDPQGTVHIFSSNGSAAFRITSPHSSKIFVVQTNGNTGLGTNAPTVPLEVYSAEVLFRGPVPGDLYWVSDVTNDPANSHLRLQGAQFVVTTNEAGQVGSIYVLKGGEVYVGNNALSETNRMTSVGFGNVHLNRKVDILQGPNNNTDTTWRFDTDRSFGPFSATQNLASITKPISNAFFHGVTITNGNVGIGTNSPAATEEIFSANANGAFKIMTPHKGPAVFVGTNGLVGIGVATPDGTLHVHTATAGAVTATAGSENLTVEDSDAGGISILTPDGNFSSLSFGSPGDSSGFVMTYRLSDDLMTFGADNSGGAIRFRVNDGTEAMRLASSGNVGIATNAPATKLHVHGQATIAGAIFITATNAADVTGPAIYTKDNTGVAEIFVRDSGGTVTQISPHAGDSPGTNVDTLTGMLPVVLKHRNDYLGEEEWIHLSALAAEVERLSGKQLVFKRNFTKRIWATDQNLRQTDYDAARLAELAARAAGDTNIVVRPNVNIRQPIPAQLGARLP